MQVLVAFHMLKTVRNTVLKAKFDLEMETCTCRKVKFALDILQIILLEL